MITPYAAAQLNLTPDKVDIINQQMIDYNATLAFNVTIGIVVALVIASIIVIMIGRVENFETMDYFSAFIMFGLAIGFVISVMVIIYTNIYVMPTQFQDYYMYTNMIEQLKRTI